MQTLKLCHLCKKIIKGKAYKSGLHKQVFLFCDKKCSDEYFEKLNKMIDDGLQR
jgi:hypothetical protein